MKAIYPARLSWTSRVLEGVIRFISFLDQRAAMRLVRLRYEKEIWHFIHVVASDDERARLAFEFWQACTLKGYRAAHCSIRTWCYRNAWRQLWGASALLRVKAPYFRRDDPDRAHRAWAQLDETSRMLVWLSKVFGFSTRTIAIIVDGFIDTNEDLHTQIKMARARARAAWAVDATKFEGPSPRRRENRSSSRWHDSLVAWSRRAGPRSNEQSPSW